MATYGNLSKTLNIRGLTAKQEAFCKLVVLEDVAITEAVQRCYPSQQFPSAYGRTLRNNPKIRSRIEQLHTARNNYQIKQR